jgi:hypothetical protein
LDKHILTLDGIFSTRSRNHSHFQSPLEKHQSSGSNEYTYGMRIVDLVKHDDVLSFVETETDRVECGFVKCGRCTCLVFDTDYTFRISYIIQTHYIGYQSSGLGICVWLFSFHEQPVKHQPSAQSENHPKNYQCDGSCIFAGHLRFLMGATKYGGRVF